MQKYPLLIGILSFFTLATFCPGLYYAIQYPKESIPLTVEGIIVQNDCHFDIEQFGFIQKGSVRIKYSYQNVSYFDTVSVSGGLNRLACNPNCCQSLYEYKRTVWLLLNAENPAKIVLFWPESSYNTSNYDDYAALLLIPSAILALTVIMIIIMFWNKRKEEKLRKFDSLEPTREMPIVQA